jgi:hypothetical protein
VCIYQGLPLRISSDFNGFACFARGTPIGISLNCQLICVHFARCTPWKFIGNQCIYTSLARATPWNFIGVLWFWGPTLGFWGSEVLGSNRPTGRPASRLPGQPASQPASQAASRPGAWPVAGEGGGAVSVAAVVEEPL